MWFLKDENKSVTQTAFQIQYQYEKRLCSEDKVWSRKLKVINVGITRATDWGGAGTEWYKPALVELVTPLQMTVPVNLGQPK